MVPPRMGPKPCPSCHVQGKLSDRDNRATCTTFGCRTISYKPYEDAKKKVPLKSRPAPDKTTLLRAIGPLPDLEHVPERHAPAAPDEIAG